MLNIDKDSIKVYRESVIPAITFAVTDNRVEEDTIIVRIDGIVLSIDWKYIANIEELPDAQVRNNPTVDGRLITHASKVIPVVAPADNNNPITSKIKSFKTFKCDLVFTLNDKVLEHVEHLRQLQKDNDVLLYIILRVSYLKHSIKLGAYATKSIENDNNIIMISDIPTKYDNSNINLKILVNADKDENRLLLYTLDEFRRQIIIPSDEWTNNFRLQLGIGN